MWARKYEDSSSDLAFRIIERAKYIQQRQNAYGKTSSFFDKLSGLFSFPAFNVPAPAYIVPAMFLLGFWLNGALYQPELATDFIDNLYADVGI